MENNSNIYKKLQYIQQTLKAPKKQYNSFGEYYYRNCEDILEAVKYLLNESNTTLILSDDLIRIGDRYYVKAIAQLIDAETGQSVTSAAMARENENKKGMDAAQVTGACSSYARKYALNGLFAIDDTKDPDTLNRGDNTDNGKKKNNNTNNADKITDLMVLALHAAIKRHSKMGVTPEKILKKYQLEKLENMSILQYQDCMDKFKYYDNAERGKENE